MVGLLQLFHMFVVGLNPYHGVVLMYIFNQFPAELPDAFFVLIRGPGVTSYDLLCVSPS